MMPKDTRLYAKFTLDFPDHYKIAGLSDAAFRTWMEMIFWSRRHLTDGFIPRRMVTDEPDAPQGQHRPTWLASVCFDLLHNDDTNPSLLEVENGYQIHDFAEHQTTRAEIEHVRQVRKTAGRRGGIASGEARRKQTQARRKQTRSKTNPETETETYIRGEGYVSNAREPTANLNGAHAPPPCPKHPWGYDHDEPCQRCKALRLYEQNADERKQIANRQADEQIRLCGLCDNRGYIGLNAGPFVKCPHDKKRIDEMEHEYEAAE
jgi:hypothetical protein